MLRRFAITFTSAVALSLAATSMALSASVTFESYGSNECGEFGRFQFAAGEGETNNVVAGSSGDRTLAGAPGCATGNPFALPNTTVFADVRNGLSTVGCTQLTGFSAACAGHQIVAIAVILGDGDDMATLANTRVQGYVFGEAGNDTIAVRNGRLDEVDCGDGTDTVHADAVDLIANCEVVNPV